jgi:transposase-like protein
MQKKRRRPSRSVEEWHQVIRAWRASGLSAERYAAEHDVTKSSLWSWSRRLGYARSKGAAFSEVRVVPDARRVESALPAANPSRGVSTASRIDVMTTSGALVRLYGDVDEQQFVKVMGVLDRC